MKYPGGIEGFQNFFVNAAEQDTDTGFLSGPDELIEGYDPCAGEQVSPAKTQDEHLRIAFHDFFEFIIQAFHGCKIQVAFQVDNDNLWFLVF